MASSSNSYQRFWGRQELPKYFQDHEVNNSRVLRDNLSEKYPYLKEIITRNPTTPLYHGMNKQQSLNYKIKMKEEANFFFTWIDKDIDHLKKKLHITCYGVCEFGNVIRVQIDNVRPYFYASFPYHIFAPEHRATIQDNLGELDINMFKEAIEKEIRTFGFLLPNSHKRDEKKINKMKGFATSYGYPEDTLIVDMRIEWHLEGVGNNMDIPKPFIRITPLLPELVNKIIFVLRNCGSRWVYDKISDKIEAERENRKKEADEDEIENANEDEDEIAFRELIEACRENNIKFTNLAETMIDKGKTKVKKPSWLADLDIPFKNPNVEEFEKPWNTWENIDSLTMLFLKDMKLKPCQWWTISNLSGSNVMFNPPLFNVDANMDCSITSIISTPDSNPISRIFPDDVVFLFDGEMKTLGKRFVNAKLGDPVAQLGIHIIRTNSLLNKMSLSESANKKLFYALLLSSLPTKSFESVHNNTDNKYNTRSISYRRNGYDDNNNGIEEELLMLKEFCDIFNYVNPSFVFAYNGNRFDYPYIIDRLYLLTKCPERYDRKLFDFNISDYICLTRDFRSNRGIFHQPAKKVTAEQTKRASVRTAYDKVNIVGVANIDLYLYVKQYAKYGLKSSYSLDSVSQKRLGERKIEINYDFIPILFQSPEGRLSIGKYCNRDVELMTRLLVALGTIEFIYLLSKKTGVTPQMLVDRGTQHLVDGIWYTTDAVYDHISLYPETNGIRDFALHNFLDFKDKYFPNQITPCTFLLPSGMFYIRDIEGPRSKGDGEKGGGADVIEPPNGLISDPAITLDFKSLYPSIMMTENVCPTTIIPYNKQDTMLKSVKMFRDHFNIRKEDAIYQRKEFWFCTGDKATAFVNLQAALDFLRSDICNYGPELKKAMHEALDKLFSNPNYEELIEKWEPVAMCQDDRIDPSKFTDEDKTDKALHDIFLNVVEPISQLTGMTKISYKNKELPMFVGKGIRQGVFPFRQRELAAERDRVKAEMARAERELEALLRQGVDKSDQRIVKLKAEISMHNIMQQAIKCMMNSMYGYYTSKFLMKFALQETVCVKGQTLLQDTKCFLETMCISPLGFICRRIVVGYGDTDSCFGILLNVAYNMQRKAFLFRIMIVFNKKEESLFNENMFEHMTKFYKEEIDKLVESGVIQDKVASKALLLVQWKVIFDDIYYQHNKFNALRCDEKDRIEDHEMKTLDALKEWFDRLFEQKMKVDITDMKNAKWVDLGRAPAPPLFGNKKCPTPKDVRMLFRWLFVNIIFEHGKRAERVVNMIFATKYNGCIIQELEKMYEEIIWWRKKKYAGCMWEPGKGAPEIKATGIDAVRGDCTPFKARISKSMLESILEDGDVETAKRIGYRAIKQVIDGKIGSTDIIQSKTFKRPPMEYGKRKANSQSNGKKYEILDTMPVHVVGAIYRHLKYGEPLPEVDERYYFIVLPNIGNVPIGKRIVPPSVLMKAGSVIQYDRLYYAKSCVNQVSNMLAPIFDRRSFVQKMEQAEMFRRIKDKKKRNKLIDAFSKEQRDEIKKHFMIYAQQGTHIRDQEHVISCNKNLLKGTGTKDIRSYFSASFVQPASSSSSVEIQDAEERVRDLIMGASVKSIGEDIEKLSIEANDEEQHQKANKPLSVDEIIENIDSYAMKMPFAFDDSILEEVNDDEEEISFITDNKKKKRCGVCFSEIRNKKKGCTVCHSRSVSIDDQELITKFTPFEKIKCVICGTISDRSICSHCKGETTERMMKQVKHEIMRKQIQEDCATCSTCVGVPAPVMPTVNESRKESRSHDNNQSIPDLEDMANVVEKFYTDYMFIGKCALMTCHNRRRRGLNESRLNAIRRIEYDYFSSDDEEDAIVSLVDDPDDEMKSIKRLRDD